MEAEIRESGMLLITADSEMESFALQTWFNALPKRFNHKYGISIKTLKDQQEESADG